MREEEEEEKEAPRGVSCLGGCGLQPVWSGRTPMQRQFRGRLNAAAAVMTSVAATEQHGRSLG